MSIASEYTRLTNAKAALKTAINAKGRNITDERIDEYADEVALIETGSSGIPAYDSLEEITSPAAGMVVKINGQEGGSGTPRGVEVGDVLGVVTWAAAPNTGLGDYWNYPEDTSYMDLRKILVFTNGDKIVAEYLDGDIEHFYIRLVPSTYQSPGGFGEIAQLAYALFWDEMTAWDASSYNFAGRTVSTAYGTVGNVIQVTPSAPAIPEKYYIYDEGWVELVRAE